MDIILLAGLWLRNSVWDEVVAELESSGHKAIGLPLPGVDDGSTTATLDDQVAAVVAAIDAADRPLVVGHSAASGLAWIAADRRPDAVAGVAMIGGFPASDGGSYADFFEPVDGLVAFPGWEPFEGPDSDDLDQQARKQLTADMVPVLEGVSRGIVKLNDDRRFAVPLNLVCPEFSPDDAKEWIASGGIPELTKVTDLVFTDIDSGHWPMVTQPAALARLLVSP